MIFFTSDTHFGHQNIISHCKRPFESVEEMDATMIKRWNDKVGKRDQVYHLGDFTFRSGQGVRDYIDQLNGRIFLILGNHDEKNDEVTKEFGICPKLIRIKYYKQRIVLCHYQMANWQGKCRDVMPSWHLFGHAHGTTHLYKVELRSMDVGVDCNNFTPLSFEEIKQAFEDDNESQRYFERENNICPS